MNFYKIDYRKLKIIHVGGTNGKGSTSNIINSIYRSSGYKVGLFTSPHLVRFNERIKIDNIEISDEDLKDIILYYKEGFEKFNLTFFEANTAIGIKYFLDNNVDIVVLEVGMGGRFDSTNIVTPVISVITGISYDHTAFLGNSLIQIAKEKAGIIKRNIPVVLNERKKFVIKKIKKISEKIEATLYLANKEFRIKTNYSLNRTVSFNWFENKISDIEFSLDGEYQVENLKTALTVVKVLQKRKVFINVTKESIETALKSIAFPGRMEKVSVKPNIIIDAAHNFQGISKVFKEISSKKASFKRIHLITGYLQDKDYQKFTRLALDTFIELGSINFVQASIERSLSFLEIENYVKRISKKNKKINDTIYSNNITFSNTVEKGYKRSLQNYRDGDLIFITGSHFIIGDFLSFFKTNKNS